MARDSDSEGKSNAHRQLNKLTFRFHWLSQAKPIFAPAANNPKLWLSLNIGRRQLVRLVWLNLSWQTVLTCLLHFHWIGPLGRFSHRVAMSVCVYVCLFVPCEKDISFHWRGLLHTPCVTPLGPPRLGLENPMVDPFVQLNTKHSYVELS